METIKDWDLEYMLYEKIPREIAEFYAEKWQKEGPTDEDAETLFRIVYPDLE